MMAIQNNAVVTRWIPLRQWIWVQAETTDSLWYMCNHLSTQT